MADSVGRGRHGQLPSIVTRGNGSEPEYNLVNREQANHLPEITDGCASPDKESDVGHVFCDDPGNEIVKPAFLTTNDLEDHVVDVSGDDWPEHGLIPQANVCLGCLLEEWKATAKPLAVTVIELGFPLVVEVSAE